MKKTVVLGASPDPSRYSNLAVQRLVKFGHQPLPVGIRKGAVAGVEIQLGKPDFEGVDTVTLYLNAERQREFYDYLFALRPRRIIFNPGAENPELEQLAQQKGIETVEGCTLVMLQIGSY